MVMHQSFRKFPNFKANKMMRVFAFPALVILAGINNVDTAIGADSPTLASSELMVAGSGIVDEAKLVDAASESTLGDYLAGNFALDTGNIKDAASYFEKALADDPENLELRRQVFMLDLADARYAAALDEARALKQQEADETNEDAQLLLALEQVKTKAFDAVPGELDGVGNQGIVALAAPFVKAWALIGSEGPTAIDAAIELLHEGESLGPLNEFHDAMLLSRVERHADALKKLDEILPATGAAPVRVAQAYAEILQREGRNEDALTFLTAQLEQGERPVLRQAVIRMGCLSKMKRVGSPMHCWA